MANTNIFAFLDEFDLQYSLYPDGKVLVIPVGFQHGTHITYNDGWFTVKHIEPNSFERLTPIYTKPSVKNFDVIIFNYVMNHPYNKIL